jgi:hypothetical protein
MIKLGLIKSGIQLITGLGVGYIADEGIKIIKPKNLTGLKRWSVKVGAFVLSAMAADKATEYVGEVWDNTVDEIKDFVKPKEIIIEEGVEAE